MLPLSSLGVIFFKPEKNSEEEVEQKFRALFLHNRKSLI